MTGAVRAMIDALLDREGGYVNDPSDPGGETNFGITARTAIAAGYSGAMRAMSRQQASAIYARTYWRTPGFEAVSAVNLRVAQELFDTGVNMGTHQAALWLQMALNAFNDSARLYGDIKEDGDLGPASLSALRAYVTARPKDGEAVMLKALNVLQGARYIDLARQRMRNERFVYGWIANRVAL